MKVACKTKNEKTITLNRNYNQTTRILTLLFISVMIRVNNPDGNGAAEFLSHTADVCSGVGGEKRWREWDVLLIWWLSNTSGAEAWALMMMMTHACLGKRVPWFFLHFTFTPQHWRILDFWLVRRRWSIFYSSRFDISAGSHKKHLFSIFRGGVSSVGVFNATVVNEYQNQVYCQMRNLSWCNKWNK